MKIKKYYFIYSGYGSLLRIDWKEDIDINDSTINYVLIPSNEDIKFVDKIRKELGYTDLASSTDNDVYYNFYLEMNLENKKEVVKVIVNNSEKDDFTEYEFECHIHWEKYQKILRKTLLKMIKKEK